jgi:hypothetical protein
MLDSKIITLKMGISVKKLAIFFFLLLTTVAAAAEDGNDWVRKSPKEKLALIERVVGNISSKGCYVKFSASYYVRQIDDFYREKDTRNMRIPEALALIGTSVGEVWDC